MNRKFGAKIIPDDKFFLPFQRRWSQDNSKFKIAEKSRQIGYTLTSAYDSVVNTASDISTDTFVSSTNEMAAKLFLSDCRKFSNILQTACEDINQDILIKDKMPASFAIRFRNGKTIYSMSSNPNSLAGRRGNITLDEFALHEQAESLLAIASPCLTWGGRMAILSTHRGYNTAFNSLIKDIKENGNPKGISLHTVRLSDALNEGFLYKLQSKLQPDDPILDMDESEYYDYIKRGCISNSIFLREYECVPDQSEDSFIPTTLIEPCLNKGQYLGEMTNNVYIGIDVGRTNDLSVIVVLNKTTTGNFVMVEMETMKNVTFTDQFSRMSEMISNYPHAVVRIDKQGLGANLAEDLSSRFGSRVRGVTTPNALKEQLAYELKRHFENRTILIDNDLDLVQDISNVRKVVLENITKFTSKRTADGHSDRYSAITLALHAAENKGGYFFTPIPV